MNKLLQKIKQGKNLTEDEFYNLQLQILDGQINENNLLDLFSALDNKGPITESELLGALKASQEKMLNLEMEEDTLDIVGTGGDKLNTFNISTLAGLVCASLGVKVAKHGNRSASSFCGSADILEKMGVNLNLNPEITKKVFTKTNFAFLFARHYHPAFKFVANARKTYGKKTYFNLLGPLLNPCKSKFLIVGLNDYSKADLMGQVLLKNGIKKAWILQGEDGMDEISLHGNTKVKEFSFSQVTREFIIEPTKLGLSKATLKDVTCQSIQDNLEIFQAILKGQATQEQTNIVALNSASGLVVSGFKESLEEALTTTKEILKTDKLQIFFNTYLQEIEQNCL